MSRSPAGLAAAASDPELLLSAIPRPLRAAGPGNGMDLAAAEAAAAGFLRALGVGLDSAHLRDTPGRLARAWAEMLSLGRS